MTSGPAAHAERPDTDVTVMPADQFDLLAATLDQPDPAPKLADTARQPRRYKRTEENP